LNCEPVVARPPSRLYEFQKTVRRHKLGFAAAAALITVLAVGALVSTAEAIRATREQQTAKRERDRAVRAEADAQQQKVNAQAEARSAAVQLADSLINQGDALTTAHEFPAAYARYSEAEGQLQRLGSPLARLDLSLVRLYRASPPPLWTTNIPDYMIGMVLLPSRKEVIAACGDGKFYALDLMSGAVNRTFGGPSAVRSLAPANTPEGPVLIAGGPDLVRLINPLSGAVIRQVDDDRAAKFCVVSPDGSLAASGNDSGTVTIWETATCKKLGGGKQVARGRQGAQISTAAFSHDGTTIAIVSDGIEFWDARTGQQIRHIPAPYSTSLAFTADDRALVCGEDIGFISVITLEGKSLARWLVCRSNNGIKSLFVTPEGNRVITASADGEVRVFDNSFGGGWTPTLTMATDKSPMLEALYVPDAGPKSCGATSGLSAADRGVVIALTLHDVFSWPLLAPHRFSDRLDGAISISSDGLLCAGQFPGRVEVRDLATGRTLRSLPQPVNIRATTFSRDSGQLYVGDDDGVLRAFDLLRGEYTWTVQGHSAPICSIDVSLDGALLASASEDGTARAWDARTGALLDTMHHRGGYGTAAIFVPAVVSGKPAALVGGPSPGAQRMIVGAGQDGSIYDWDISHHSYPRPAYAIGATHGLTLSPDQKLVVASSVAHRANLLDAATLAQVGSLGPIPSGIAQVCFIDNGAGPGAWALACGGRELRVFEMASGRERLVLDSTLDDLAVTSTYTGTYYPNSMAASPDGAIVVAKGAGRISFTLPRLYRELLRAPSPLRQTDFYSEWGLWAWVRELLERERAAGRDCPPLLLARANWMCGDYKSARRAFDLAVATHATPAWYAALCSSVGDNPPTAAPLPATPRPKDTLEQLPAAEPLPEGVLAAAELPVLTSLIGKEVVVEGVVSDSAWSRSGKVMNIRFAGVEEGKLGLFSCLFLKDRAAFDSAFGGDAAGAFSGARLRIRGALDHYGGFDFSLKGQPQMILTDPKQVTIVEQRPAHGELPVPVSASGRRAREAELAFKQAVLLGEQGKLAEAEAPCREAITLFKQLAQDDPKRSDPRIKLGHLQWQLGDTLLALGRRDEAEQVLSEALQVFANAVTNFPDVAFLHQEQGYSAWKLATMLESAGRLDAAEAEYRQAIALHEKASADFPNEAVFTERLSALKVRLVKLLLRRGTLAEADATTREAAQKCHMESAQYEKLASNPSHHQECCGFAIGYEELGSVLMQIGKTQAAETAYRDTQVLWRKLVADFSTEDYRFHLAVNYDALGNLLRETGRATESLEAYRAAQAVWLKLVADFNLEDRRVHLAWTDDNIGQLLKEAGQLEEAAAAYRQALAVWKKLVAEFNKDAYRNDLSGTLARLAATLQTAGNWTEAEALLRETAKDADAQTLNGLAWLLATGPDPKLRDGSNAVAYAERSVSATGRTNVSYLDTLAAAYAETGQFAKAISVQQEAIALSQSEPEKKDLASRLKLYENKSPYRDHGSLAELTNARLREGKFAEAEGLARECLAIRERDIPDDWRTFNAHSMLGGSLLGQMKYPEAEPFLLSGYEGMKQREVNIPLEGKVRLSEALQRLVQLYEATHRPDQAAEWKQKLEMFNRREAATQAAPAPKELIK
jgi:WD40 repeat protein/tetratricopeptide (TPR) repeat protein